MSAAMRRHYGPGGAASVDGAVSVASGYAPGMATGAGGGVSHFGAGPVTATTAYGPPAGSGAASVGGGYEPSMQRVGSGGSFASSAQSRGGRSGTPLGGGDVYTDRVKVVVRVRPLMPHETERGDSNAVVSARDGSYLQCITAGAGDRELHKNYKFDLCLGPETQQEAVFEATGVKHLVDSALNGYAATVFAYGQTGSGKTYTMAGMEERIASEEWLEREHAGGESIDGIIPRAARYLFEDCARARAADPSLRLVVRASYCEIYNEQVFDLLNLKSQTLPVRWNEKNGFFVQGLLVCTCENVDDVMAVVNEGHRNRSVGTHALNMDSSRSHCILTLSVESATIDPDDGHTVVKYGKIVFTDLAGSERLKESNSEGIAKKETGQINKSLFTLGKVISALGDAKRKAMGSHVPYRDSKLTKLLMDSLGGNSLTIMIACVSPSHVYIEETLNTLNYATRANNIKNKPSVHVDPQEQLIFNLRQEIKLLRMENEYLRGQLGLRGGTPFPLPRTWANTPGGATPPPGYAPAPGSPMSAPASPLGGGVAGSGGSTSATGGIVTGGFGGGGAAGQMRPGSLPDLSESAEYAGAGAGARSHSVTGSRPHRVPPLGPDGTDSPQGSPAQPRRPTSGGPRSPRVRGSNGSPSAGPRRRSGSASGASSSGSLYRKSLRRGSAGVVDGGTGGSSSDSSSPGSARGGASPKGHPRSAQERLEHYDEMVKLLEEYQGEVARLRRENGAVRARATVSERDYTSIMSENERLASKLEHLEEVFVSGGGATPRTGVIGAGSHGDATWGKAPSGPVDAEESERLREALRKVLADNDVLRRRLGRSGDDTRDGGVGGGVGGGRGGAEEDGLDGPPDFDGPVKAPLTGRLTEGGSSPPRTEQLQHEIVVLRQTNQGLHKRVGRLQQREAELLRMLRDAKQRLSALSAKHGSPKSGHAGRGHGGHGSHSGGDTGRGGGAGVVSKDAEDADEDDLGVEETVNSPGAAGTDELLGRVLPDDMLSAGILGPDDDGEPADTEFEFRASSGASPGRGGRAGRK